MRKFMTIILSALFILSLAGCKSEDISIASNQEEVIETVDNQKSATSQEDTKVEIEKGETQATEEPVAEPVQEPEVIEEPVEVIWENDADISWIDATKPMAALSFDDGPVSTLTDTSTAIRIQNALSENGMHATFFYWGNTLNSNTRKELERAFELGFELGNHTKSHLDLTKLTAEEMLKQVEFIDKTLSEITGKEAFLVRPPYLSVNQLVRDTLKVPLISCGIDSKDWANATADEMIETIKKAAEDGSLDGKIVLMHETYDATATAVEYLVPYLKEQGYQVVTISEMFKARGRDMKSGKFYKSCEKK